MKLKNKKRKLETTLRCPEYEEQDFEFLINVGSGEEIESFNHPFLKLYWTFPL